MNKQDNLVQKAKMATLNLIYDLESKSFVGTHVDGRYLDGLNSVVLGKGMTAVLDRNGEDMLASLTQDERTPDEKAQANLELATLFGYEPTPAGGQS